MSKKLSRPLIIFQKLKFQPQSAPDITVLHRGCLLICDALYFKIYNLGAATSFGVFFFFFSSFLPCTINKHAKCFIKRLHGLERTSTELRTEINHFKRRHHVGSSTGGRSPVTDSWRTERSLHTLINGGAMRVTTTRSKYAKRTNDLAKRM